MRIRSDGEHTRARILEAACAVFGEKGYHKATCNYSGPPSAQESVDESG